MMIDQLEAPAAVARQGKPRASDPVKVLSLIQAQEKKQAGRLEIYRAVEAAYDRVPPDDDSALDADKLGWTANIDWKAVLFAIFGGSIIGAFVSLLMILLGRREWAGRIPFGPYLAAGAVIWLFTGPEFLEWYLALARGPAVEP